MTQHVNICQWNRTDCFLICMFLYKVAMKLLNTNHKQTTTFRQPPFADSCFSSWKSRIRTHENLCYPCLLLVVVFLLFFMIIFLWPNWSSDLKYGPWHPARDWFRRVSKLVRVKYHDYLRRSTKPKQNKIDPPWKRSEFSSAYCLCVIYMMWQMEGQTDFMKEHQTSVLRHLLKWDWINAWHRCDRHKPLIAFFMEAKTVIPTDGRIDGRTDPLSWKIFFLRRSVYWESI